MSNIKVSQGWDFKEVNFTTFSDNAEEATADVGGFESKLTTVICNVEDCSRDAFRLMLVKDLLDAVGIKDVNLTLLYTPYARADRRFTKGSSHSLKCFTNILNSLKFNKVLIADPHSDVTTALIDNVYVLDQTVCFKSMLPLIEDVSKDYILCAPDLGATKKIFDTVRAIGHTEYLQAVKIRDVTTGNIIKCDIQCEDLHGKDVVIVDDLCDFGNSFKFLAKKLKEKGVGKVILYVTHGIFAGGVEPLRDDIDFIFCYNLMERYTNSKSLENFNGR